MIDLHTHSSASDGQLSPEKLVEAAFAGGLRAVALTDHDTVDGLERAEKKAAELGLTFVSGIELSVKREKGEFHLLGLGIKKISAEMQSLLERCEKNRNARNEKIVSLMADAGIKLDLREFCEQEGTKSVGRPHFARFLAQKGFAKSANAAFKKFLAPGAPFFAKIEGCDLDDAILAVKSCGAAACLAHPMSLYMSWGKFSEYIPELKERGIQAIEAWHSGARRVECERLEELAKKNGMATSAGSDFHGEGRADRILGHYDARTELDDKFFFEEILPLIA